MNVKVSREKIWWNIVNENVPSKEYFENFKTSMIEEKVKVNYQTLDNVSIVSKKDDITYVWINHLGKDYFYYVNSIVKVLNKGYLLALELDVWATYTLPYIYNLRNNNVEVQCLRSHLFNDKSIQYDDSLLEAVDKQYNSIDSIKNYFPSYNNDGEIIYYNEKGGISNCDINANMYYVFKEGVNGNYTFIPLLSNTVKNNIYIINYEENYEDVYIFNYRKNETRVSTVYSVYFNGKKVDKNYMLYHNGNNFDVKYNYSSMNSLIGVDINLKTNLDIDAIVKDAYNKNKKIKWEIATPSINTRVASKWKPLLDYFSNASGTAWKDITNKVIYGTLPSNFYMHNEWKTELAGSMYSYKFKTLLRSVEMNTTGMYYNTWKNEDAIYFEEGKKVHYIDSAYYDVGRYAYSPLLRVSIGERRVANGWEKIQVNNNKVALDKLKFSQELSNKFLGIYFLPHVLDVIDNYSIQEIQGEKYLTINFPAEGYFLSPFSIIDLFVDKWWCTFNNPNIANKNIFKYLNVWYYNNVLKPQFRIQNKMGRVKVGIGGYFYFASNGVLISKPNLLSLQDGVINYPYTLPTGTDLYINYVNSTKNSADTSYNITKQNAIVNGVFGTISGLSNIAVGAGTLGFTPNIFKMTNDYAYTLTRASMSFGDNIPLELFAPAALNGKGYSKLDNSVGNFLSGSSILNGITNIGQSITNSVLAVKQKERQLRSHYADKQNTLSNQILDSQSNDSKWLYYNSEEIQTQYNFCEFRNLSENSIKALNNVIYLYGEYYPRIININKIWNFEEIPFRYIQLDKDYLSLNFLDYNVAPLHYKDMILDKLDGGVRIWDMKPKYNNYSDLREEDKKWADTTDIIEEEIDKPIFNAPSYINPEGNITFFSGDNLVYLTMDTNPWVLQFGNINLNTKNEIEIKSVNPYIICDCSKNTFVGTSPLLGLLSIYAYKNWELKYFKVELKNSISITEYENKVNYSISYGNKSMVRINYRTDDKKVITYALGSDGGSYLWERNTWVKQDKNLFDWLIIVINNKTVWNGKTWNKI